MFFEFATATRIVFGPGMLRRILPELRQYGRRALVVAGSDPELSDHLCDALRASGVEAFHFPIEGEPSIVSALAGLRVAQDAGCDFVIGMGGGSAIDTGKAVSALMTNPGDILDYLEVIGKGLPLQHPAAPFVAVPTTAGTGSEVTRNAVLSSPEHHVKVSLRSPLMLPKLAVVDPELTYKLPPELTASTGLDALAQLIEPYVSNGCNPLIDPLCREGIGKVANSLPRAFRNGFDADARQDMALASLFGGLALANARLGAVHGLAGPLGGMYPVPHGVACARLLPHAVRINLRALRQRASGSISLQRFEEVARLLTGNREAEADAGASWLENTCKILAIPPLRSYGLQASEFHEVVKRAQQASSMKGNPLPLADEEVTEILLLESNSP
jgi:alcohol dehydrogenase class IV